MSQHGQLNIIKKKQKKNDGNITYVFLDLGIK